MAKKTNGHTNGHVKNARVLVNAWTKRIERDLDHDPEIDRVRTIVQKERIKGRVNESKETSLAIMAGLTPSTVKNMLGGETRRPQHRTYVKILGAMGYGYDIVQKHEINYDRDLSKAREERRAYKIMLAAKAERAERK